MGHLAGDHLEQQDARSVNIGATIGIAALDLLGGEIRDGADDHALGCARIAGLDCASQAKVGNLDSTVIGDEHVLWLDVAMDETRAVRGLKSFENRVE